jgi:hypothetical protein
MGLGPNTNNAQALVTRPKTQLCHDKGAQISHSSSVWSAILDATGIDLDYALNI